MKRTTFHALAGLAAMALATGGAYATPISPSPTLTVGALTFSDFSTSITGEGSYSPTMASGIAVSTLMTGLPGIEFTGDFDAFGSGSSGDVALDYSVMASSGTKIDDVWLGLGGATLVGSGANVTVTECAYADAAHTMLLGGNCLSVYDPPPVLTDELSLGGDYSTVYITKDISYNAGTCTASCNAALSIIDQRFSTVPEPGTLALFGGSLLGCALFVGRRRRSQQTRA
jgi:hypothetical protein